MIYTHKKDQDRVKSKVKILSSAYTCTRKDQSKALVDGEGHMEKGEPEVGHEEINQLT